MKLITLYLILVQFNFRLSPLETPLNANSAYMPTRSKNVNMVANVCPLAKQDNLHMDLGKERTLDLRNSTESLDKDLKCGTLQKVKKTYIWKIPKQTMYGSINKWLRQFSTRRVCQVFRVPRLGHYVQCGGSVGVCVNIVVIK